MRSIAEMETNIVILYDQDFFVNVYFTRIELPYFLTFTKTSQKYEKNCQHSMGTGFPFHNSASLWDKRN